VLGLPRASSEADVRAAFAQLARRFHPDKAHEPALADLSPELHAIFVRLAAAYEVLAKPASRAEYEQRLGRARPTPTRAGTAVPDPAVPAGGERSATPATTGAPAAATHTPDAGDERLLLDQVLRDGRRHYEAGRHWEAIQTLEPALALARTAAQRQLVRVALAKAVLKNPKWVRRAEELLRAAVDEDPRNWEALFLLASIYKSGGLTRRAARLLRQVLELQPGHAEARAELAALEAGPHQP
jgi:curved DNA-binding protein CbpA